MGSLTEAVALSCLTQRKFVQDSEVHICEL